MPLFMYAESALDDNDLPMDDCCICQHASLRLVWFRSYDVLVAVCHDCAEQLLGAHVKLKEVYESRRERGAF